MINTIIRTSFAFVIGLSINRGGKKMKQKLLHDLLQSITSIDAYKSLGEAEKEKLDQDLQKINIMVSEAEVSPKKIRKRAGNISRKFLSYQLKVSLKGVRPPIWRRILVPGNIKFDTLHEVIQIAMGWQNSHLYSFEIDDVVIEIPESEDELGFFLPSIRQRADSRKEQLKYWTDKEKAKFTYTYDFGDNWEHIIQVEKVEVSQESLEHPICLRGKRACPPEGSGGIHAYKVFMNTITGNGQNDEMDDEYRDYLLSFYENFDPEEFDLEFINTTLTEISF
jgi:hypothetical protein